MRLLREVLDDLAKDSSEPKEWMVPIARAACSRGLAALAIDLPGYGESHLRGTRLDGREALRASARGALDFLSSRGIDRVGTFGVSLEGLLSHVLAALEPKIRASAGLGGPYPSPDDRRLFGIRRSATIRPRMGSPDAKTEAGGARRATTRTFLVLWIAGLVGVLAFLPVIAGLLPRGSKQHLPVAVVLVLAGGQNAVIVAGAAAAVVFLGRSVGLRSPVAEAWAERRPIARELPRPVSAGLGAGLIGALFATFAAPDFVAYLRSVPLPARLLYGGIVEELVLRGGLMTLLAWGAHRLLQRRGDVLRLPTVALAILVSNAAFALGHLPMLTMNHVPSPHRAVGVIFIVALPWGWLYYRRGFEAAVVAHATFHAAVAAIAAIR
jgi:pimeloyl-ACP methyl ester carboxylesterase